MKKQILLFTMLSAIVLTLNAQTTWRVNNNTSADAHFETLQEAHDSATAGDVIYLEPSGTSYGSCTFTKQLTVIGPGYFLAENDTTAFYTGAKTDTITFNSGSEGSVIMGCFITSYVSINADNITLKRNRVEYNTTTLITNYGDNTTITQCYISNDYSSGSPKCVTSSGLNFIFTNNFVNTEYTYNSYDLRITGGNAEIANNLFSGQPVAITNSHFYNNMYNSSLENNGSNNIEFNMNYADSLVVGGSSPDGKYQLAEGSAAIGAGKDGVDCGMFGGSEPYVISGIPSMPTIINVSMPSSGSQSGGLPVTIKIQSNN